MLRCACLVIILEGVENGRGHGRHPHKRWGWRGLESVETDKRLVLVYCGDRTDRTVCCIRGGGQGQEQKKGTSCMSELRTWMLGGTQEGKDGGESGTHCGPRGNCQVSRWGRGSPRRSGPAPRGRVKA